MKVPGVIKIDENESYNIKTPLIDVNADQPDQPLTISEVNVMIFVPSDSDTPVYVNGRDGTLNTGLTVTSGLIDFHMLPADNVIIDAGLYAKSGYETHLVRFEVKYNSGSDIHYLEFEVHIRNLTHVS